VTAPERSEPDDREPGRREPGRRDSDSREPDSRELGRLRWRCRRGMRELDVLLTRFLDQRFCTASPATQDAFRRLLESHDPLIHAYCLGQLPAPTAELAALVAQITAAAGGVP
jgi:antitoxin CptB